MIPHKDSHPPHTPILFLVGATATGKTQVSIELAKRFPLEIVNADSLQVYTHLDIGTAKPSKKIRMEIPHHLIDIIDPDKPLTSKEYRDLAEEKFREIHGRKKIPLVVGGAGFYIKAVTSPVNELPSGTAKIIDAKKAHQALSEQDPSAAQKIHPNDHYRLSRALFLLERGIRPSEAFKTQESTLPYSLHWLGISCDRETLRNRIGTRVKIMFETGLMDETRQVLKLFPGSRDRLERTIGYSQCLETLDSKISEKEALAQTIIRTNQYAKRQDTWFRKNPSIIWSPLTAALEHFSVSIDGIVRV